MLNKYQLSNKSRRFEFLITLSKISRRENDQINNAIENACELVYEVTNIYNEPDEILEEIGNIFSRFSSTCMRESNAKEYNSEFQNTFESYQDLEEWTFNEALFLMIGFTPDCIDIEDLSTYIRPEDAYQLLTEIIKPEYWLSLSKECQLLKQKFKKLDQIPVNECIKWLVVKGYYEKQKTENTENRIYPEWLAKGLYEHLTSQRLIEGDYGQMWTWTPKYKNSLAYLADELSSKFKSECPIERKQPNLTSYIEYSGARFRQMSESKDYPARDKINIVISKLKKNKPQT